MPHRLMVHTDRGPASWDLGNGLELMTEFKYISKLQIS